MPAGHEPAWCEPLLAFSLAHPPYTTAIRRGKALRMANAQELLPSTNRIRSNQSGIVLRFAITHAKQVSIGQIFRDVSFVGKWNVRALPRKADVKPVISPVAMRKQPNPGSLPAANCSKQHGFPLSVFGLLRDYERAHRSAQSFRQRKPVEN